MKKTKLTGRFGAKLLAWLLLALSVLGLLTSAAGIVAAWEVEVYSAGSPEELKSAHFNTIFAGAGYNLAFAVVEEGQTDYADLLAGKQNAEFRLTDPEGTELWKSPGYDALGDSPYRYTHVFRKLTMEDGSTRFSYYPGKEYLSGTYATPTPASGVMSAHAPAVSPTPVPSVQPTGKPVTSAQKPEVTPTPAPAVQPTKKPAGAAAREPVVTPTPAPQPAEEAAGPAGELPAAETADYLLEAAVDPVLPLRDEYHWTGLGLDLIWAMRYAVYVLAGLSLLLGVLSFIFLLCAAGHRAGREELTPGYLTGIPFDLLTAATALLCAGLLWLAREAIGSMRALFAVPLVGAGGLVLLLILFLTGWCTSLALRLKLGRWWENTLLWRLMRLLLRGLRGFLRALAALLRGLPLVWRTVLLILAVGFLELLTYFGLRLWRNNETFLLFWSLEKLLLGGGLLYLALVLRRLQRGGEALAAGDLRYQTDTRAMLGNFRRHGEDLNAIAAGMEAAVERQMRSERMKTELITNVSHDIKTPLTGIVSYIDLLKTASDPARREEYIAVLDRQAGKLKKLTEDLVEVSKASTGNMEVTLSRHSVSELLRQAVGEYSERLEAAGLETVLTLPEEELFAGMDGKLMWRVLDNLLNNVCKYAQSGTRFYVDGLTEKDSVVIRFKNVSRDPLNLSAEELMERFVRGDRARGGEGSGLGLSIARSLTELQRGTFALTVDGDLFKAELAFPGA